MTFLRRLKQLIIGTFIIGLLTVIALAAWLWWWVMPELPDIASLQDYHLHTPLQVYTRDGKLISEFGEQRRFPISIDEVPQDYINALLASEDANFYNHVGVDPKALLRAAVRLVQAGGEIQGGGSTITMQVARNYLLTLEQTFSRKLNEILLSLQIEQVLSKDRILEMYINKMFMGHRAYGIKAAAEVYYGKPLQDLNIAQYAMLAGLFKAPSSFNPLSNPQRAQIRRDWILGRMQLLGYIDQTIYQEAINQPVSARFHSLKPQTQASYVAEMVRLELINNFGFNDIYTSGYQVYTTVDSRLQDAAQQAVQEGLLSYDRRHGYRDGAPEATTQLSAYEAEKKLNRLSALGPLEPAYVRSINSQAGSARILMRYGVEADIYFADMAWMKPYITVDKLGDEPDSIDDIIALGNLIYVRQVPVEPEPDKEQGATDEVATNPTPTLESNSPKTKWVMAQLPNVEGALVALNPKNGAIIALVGGYEYQHSKFNRATMSLRQPGSSFKPFIYSAALENGFTAASIINDAPIVFNDVSLEGAWKPQNYSGKYIGPTRMRQALYQSKNLVSIRLLREMGVKTAIDYIVPFGFKKSHLSTNLSLALGSADVPPLDVATAYAAIANGGYAVKPYFIERIEDKDGNLLYLAKPSTVCEQCIYLPDSDATSLDQIAQELDNAESLTPTLLPIAPKIMDERTNYILHTMLQDVVKLGTGRRALSLKRPDLAGKTGTTNDQKDVWFSGYNSHLVATTWVGFDQPTTLGKKEFGSSAALPIWIDFMKTASEGNEPIKREVPEGLIQVRIDKDTGKLATTSKNSVTEWFREENNPAIATTKRDVTNQQNVEEDKLTETIPSIF